MLDLMRRRSSAYQHLFKGPNASTVLADLARFCHVHASLHVPGDPCGTALLEGRRQVWLRLQGFLRLSDDAIAGLVEQAQMREND